MKFNRKSRPPGTPPRVGPCIATAGRLGTLIGGAGPPALVDAIQGPFCQKRDDAAGRRGRAWGRGIGGVFGRRRCFEVPKKNYKETGLLVFRPGARTVVRPPSCGPRVSQNLKTKTWTHRPGPGSGWARMSCETDQSLGSRGAEGRACSFPRLFSLCGQAGDVATAGQTVR